MRESVVSIDREVLHAGVEARAVARQTRLRILCATHALSLDDAAVCRAQAIAREQGAEVVLLHVVDSARPARAALARVILEAHARRLAAEHIDARMEVRSGIAYDAIAQAAVEMDVDLIVLGFYRQRLGDGLRGTAAERIAAKAQRPVLVSNLKSGSPYRHVLLTADLSRRTGGIARVTSQLGLLQGSEVSVIHALDDSHASMLSRAGVPRTEVDSYRRFLRRQARDEIRAQLLDAGLERTDITVYSPHAPAARAIGEVAKLAGCDLVVVGTSRFPALKRLLFGSVSNGVMKLVDGDILIVSPGAHCRPGRRSPLSAAVASPRAQLH